MGTTFLLRWSQSPTWAIPCQSFLPLSTQTRHVIKGFCEKLRLIIHQAPAMKYAKFYQSWEWKICIFCVPGIVNPGEQIIPITVWSLTDPGHHSIPLSPSLFPFFDYLPSSSFNVYNWFRCKHSSSLPNFSIYNQTEKLQLNSINTAVIIFL